MGEIEHIQIEKGVVCDAYKQNQHKDVPCTAFC